MKSTTNKPLACDALWNSKPIITEAEMQEIDESLRPIETKAIAKAKKDLFWGRAWLVCNLTFLAIIIYALFHFAGAGYVS